MAGEETAQGSVAVEETAQGVVAMVETAQGWALETVLELTQEKAKEVAPGMVPALAQETAQGIALEMVLQQPHRNMHNSALVEGSEGDAGHVGWSARRLWLRMNGILAQQALLSLTWRGGRHAGGCWSRGRRWCTGRRRR